MLRTCHPSGLAAKDLAGAVSRAIHLSSIFRVLREHLDPTRRASRPPDSRQDGGALLLNSKGIAFVKLKIEFEDVYAWLPEEAPLSSFCVFTHEPA